MDDEEGREAKRIICKAVREEWAPKLRNVIRTIVAERGKTWSDACDAAELTIVTSSEEIKIRAEAEREDSEQRVGWEISAQAMLDIIARLRAEGL